jgi:type VI secretion system protein ImpH
LALHLKRDEVPGLRLQGTAANSNTNDLTSGARLGWNTWLTSGAPVHDNHRVVIAGQAGATHRKETSDD